MYDVVPGNHEIERFMYEVVPCNNNGERFMYDVVPGNFNGDGLCMRLYQVTLMVTVYV